MAREEVLRLYRSAQGDPQLRQRLNRAPNPETFVEMAQAQGYSFTVEEWMAMTRFEVEELQGDLSEIPGI